MNYRLTQLNNRPANQYLPAANLRVSPYQIEQILEMKIQHRLNQHTTCYIKGLLPEAIKDTYAKQPAKATNLIVSIIDNTSGEEYILFQGLVQESRIQAAKGVYYLEVNALSYSSQLDIEKKSRSFQDKQKTYTDLIQEITYPYPGGDILDKITNGARTEAFIMQHQETDWELLLRLASRFNTGVIGNAIFDAPKLYFGLHSAQNLALTAANYELKKDLSQYRRLTENGVTGLSEGDFLSYTVETDRLINIGDQITFQGQALYAAAVDHLTDKGLLVSRLILMPQAGLKQLRQTNPNLIGAAYSGNILAAQNDQVQVTLNVDTEINHDPGAPCWFPYSTIYSSRDGSGWYCMPETGDRVRIYFPDGEDDHAYAINSVHEPVAPARQNQNTVTSSSGSAYTAADTGSYSGMRDNPSVKSLTYGANEVRLTPDGVYILTAGSLITMTAAGITLASQHDIAFKSEQNIVLNAEDQINIAGAAGVNLTSGDTTNAVLIKDNVQIVGQEVKAN